jgi:hypothetical protein
MKMKLELKLMKYALLTLLLLPLVIQAEDVGQAKIITSGEQPAKCISAVEVNQIDGKEVLVQKLGFSIDAGKHTINARAIVNNSFCKVTGVDTGNDPITPIEYDFEAGKTYYLGYDHSANMRKDWQLVVWKVKD